jgi:TetR/AcrR family transcriptional repressor of nem operon
MSRYSTAHKGTTRARILAASDRLLKDRGPEAASVAAVMREAGLTVGGFYGHFTSKDELKREALLFGVEASFARLTEGLDDLRGRPFLRALIRRYLEQVGEAALEEACPMTLLLPEVARSDDAFRMRFAECTAALLAKVENRFPEVPGMTRRDVALAVFAALSGTVAMARATPAPRAQARIAAATEALLTRFFGLDADGAC